MEPHTIGYRSAEKRGKIPLGLVYLWVGEILSEKVWISLEEIQTSLVKSLALELKKNTLKAKHSTKGRLLNLEKTVCIRR